MIDRPYLYARLHDIATDLLAEEGIGSHELGYMYDVLMDHVRAKLLQGKTAGASDVRDLRHAFNRISQLSHNFKGRAGLVASIVKYKDQEPAHAK